MKPRLLIILNRFVIGGQALDTIPLAYYLQKDFEIKVLYGCKENDEAEPWFLLEKYPGVLLEKIPWLERSVNPVKDFKAYGFIKKQIKEFKPQIVHTHGAKSGLLGRLAAHHAKVPLVLHTFHGHLFHSYFNSVFTSLLVFIERWLAKYSTAIIALSELQKKELVTVLRVKDEKIKVIPLGIDYIDPLKKDIHREQFRNKFNITDNTVCIGLLGRIVPIKNTDFFIHVIKYIWQQHRNLPVKFFLIGDGQDKAKAMQQLLQSNIPYSNSGETDAYVFFTSWVEDVQAVLDGLDILALTSHNEGTPMSLIEAQFCGKPVVAVHVGGVKDTMLPDESGFLLPDHEISTFAEALVKLINDPQLRSRMGEAGRQFVAGRFSKQSETVTFAALYKSLLQMHYLNKL